MTRDVIPSTTRELSISRDVKGCLISGELILSLSYIVFIINGSGTSSEISEKTKCEKSFSSSCSNYSARFEKKCQKNQNMNYIKCY